MKLQNLTVERYMALRLILCVAMRSKREAFLAATALPADAEHVRILMQVPASVMRQTV